MKKIFHFLILLLGGSFLLSACMAPLPTPTPVPALAEPTQTATAVATHALRATATPLPSATPLPQATSAPQPPATTTPAAGYYRDQELGFWFKYPPNWFAESTGSNLPSVILSDNDDPLSVWAGARPLQEGTTLAEFAAQVKDEMGFAETVELIRDDDAVLADGTPARELLLSWEDEVGGAYQAHGYVAVTSTNGYVLFLTGRAEVVSARQQTVTALAGGMHLEQPELFGVSRSNALFLLRNEPNTLDPALSSEGVDGVVAHIFPV